ncbi:peptidase associated domain and porin domain-containing protein [Arachidicoccus terrestris]|uniref:hypothetical protein n=1 Tax=Arachidicoccus terrestris TaxID=2875539 RepID=UPI001CC4ACAA|nr:hypothetical protein [Arachidicoccus terrestris]UAY56105.1 hypothetical protein K9M52_03495 [Arachidicoccus terrestris]
MFRKGILLIFILSIHFLSNGQTADTSASAGEISGVVKDSVRNYVLQSATISIYRYDGKKLLAYQLTNNFGEFAFTGLPLAAELLLKIDFVGYKSFSEKFIIPSKVKKVVFGNISMEKGDDSLEAVTVTAIPPVVMNGDTLEFNADAFTLDPNAVAEDLLKRLPGVMIWGDGVITVNGRPVKTVLVDGKKFFSSNSKIATQNIPKEAIDKVQVYQQNKDKNNPLDSTTAINIKLKADSHSGFFGKASAGGGTRQHYELDGSINRFSPFTKVALVTANNNTNKTAASVDDLLLANVFKGLSADITYQPDFSMPGMNTSRMAGGTFLHDFHPVNHVSSEENLSGKYLFNSNANKLSTHVETKSTIGDDSVLNQRISNVGRYSGVTHKLNAEYNLNRPYSSLNMFLSGSIGSTNGNNQSMQSSEIGSEGVQSSDSSADSKEGKNQKVDFGLSFNKSKKNTSSRLPGSLSVYYKFSHENDHNIGDFSSSFTSVINPDQSRYLDRRYDRRSVLSQHHLTAEFGNFSNWIFGVGNFLSTIDITLVNDLYLTGQHHADSINDFNFDAGLYKYNAYLSNTTDYLHIKETPSIRFSRIFSKSLADRYDKTLSFVTGAGLQFSSQNNQSSHSFQDFHRNYSFFVPSFTAKYINNEFGLFKDTYILDYQVDMKYVSPDLLYPLVDSSNLYLIQAGNPRLKPAKMHQLLFTYNHETHKTRNPLNYSASVRAGWYSNSLTDSSIVDENGGFLNYMINMNGRRFLNAEINFKKAIKINSNHSLQAIGSSQFGINRIPSYLRSSGNPTSKYNISQTNTNSNSLALFYLYKDLLVVNLKEELSFYRSVQRGISDQIFRNSSLKSIFSFGLNCTKRLKINSNITLNNYSSSQSVSSSFSVWNAAVTYRFLKKDNLEFKFSALDLLHQNKSIVVSGNNYRLTRSETNVLQQYFLFTISYFPRKFGQR